MKYILSIIVVAIFLIVAVAIFVWSGRYNVAATVPHWDITVWLMKEMVNRSIKFHSRGIQPPPSKDPKLVSIGFREFHAMCRLCHGAPSYPPSEFAQGLYPKPPDLGEKETQNMSDAELYWVVKNGIKMTGMPGFGPTHAEEELRAIVAFVKRIPDIQAKEYEAMAREAERGKEKKDHHHDSKKH